MEGGRGYLVMSILELEVSKVVERAVQLAVVSSSVLAMM